MHIDYDGLLHDAVRGANARSAEARERIYELARATLKQQMLLNEPPMTEEEMRGELLALTQAITRVEGRASAEAKHATLIQLRESQRRARTLPSVSGANATGAGFDLQSPAPATSRRFDALTQSQLVRAQIQPVEILSPIEVDARQPPKRGSIWQIISDRFAEATRALLVAGIAVLAYIQLSEPKREERTGPPQKTNDAAAQRNAVDSASASQRGGRARSNLLRGAPPPTLYGVYASLEGRLAELSPITTMPVDPRVKTPVQISQPSSVRLPGDHLGFVIYRRDLANSAPDKISVRVVARLARMMKFEPGGNSFAAPQGDTWILRNNGYEFRVMPLPEDREMIFVRPAELGMTLPAGRYALIFNEQLYDFTIEGAVRDPAQCVEGAPTARGPVFYDCPPGVSAPNAQ